jgi:predicted nucleic acid-binding protein
VSGAVWVLDANVLYPTVLREVLLGCAEAGLYQPAWSPRISEEWARTAQRQGGLEDAAWARAEIARLSARFDRSATTHDPAEEASLCLPDPGDIHVLATARAAGAEGIVTMNLRDFPRREMAALDLRAVHPDPFVLDLMSAAPDVVEGIVARVHAEAQRLSGADLPLRDLLKRARLPRLGRALTR